MRQGTRQTCKRAHTRGCVTRIPSATLTVRCSVPSSPQSSERPSPAAIMLATPTSMYDLPRQRQEMTGNSSPPDTEEIIQCLRMNNGEPAGPSAEPMGNFDTADTSSQGTSPAHETQMSWERENAAMQEGGSPASSRSASPVQLPSDPRKGTYVGLRNQGSTCYLNSLLQCLFFTRELREAILSCDNYDSGIMCQLKKLFQELKRNKSVPSTEGITKCLGVKDVHQQQDVVEYFRILMNKIIEDNEAIQQLYQVEMVHSITCHGCKHQTRIKEDPVLSLALSLDKCNLEAYSVCKALAAVQKVNEFTGDEQFYCEICESKQEATSRCYFETLPHILVLNLKRYQFDGNWFRKLNYEVSVPFSLTVNSEEQPNTQYELFAICHHSGGIYGGHYVAEIKSFENDCWYNFNDTIVSEVQEEWNSTGAKNSSTAYLLMYRMAAGDAKPKPAPAAPAKLMQEAQPEPEIQPSASVESSSQSMETLLSSESLPVRPSQSSQPCKKLVSPASGKQFQAEQEADEGLKGTWMAAQSDCSEAVGYPTAPLRDEPPLPPTWTELQGPVPTPQRSQRRPGSIIADLQSSVEAQPPQGPDVCDWAPSRELMPGRCQPEFTPGQLSLPPLQLTRGRAEPASCQLPRGRAEPAIGYLPRGTDGV